MFNFEVVSMCCAFRSLPLVACLWLIITFGCTCFGSIDETNKQNKITCDDEIDITEGKMNDNKTITFNDIDYPKSEYFINSKNRTIACFTPEPIHPKILILPKSK